MTLENVKGFLIDIDGVLTIGETAIPGAREAIECAQIPGLPVPVHFQFYKEVPGLPCSPAGQAGIRYPQKCDIHPAACRGKVHGGNRKTSGISPNDRQR